MKTQVKKLSVISYALGITLLISAAFSSCNIRCIKGNGNVMKKTLILDDITGIDLSNNADVYVEYGKTQLVEVEASINLIDNLKKSVKDGTWKIDNRKCVRGDEKIKVYLTLPQLDYFELSGSGDVKIGDFNTQENIQYRISGSGNIYQSSTMGCSQVLLSIAGSGDISINNLECTTLRYDIGGSGNISTNGSALMCSADISGSGDIDAFGLSATNISVDISGSGNCKLTANEKLSVDISGSGDVYYKGQPTIYSNISGSGKITNKN